MSSWFSNRSVIGGVCALVVLSVAIPTLADEANVRLEEIYRFDKEGTVYDLRFIDEGRRVLIGSDPTDSRLAIWNVESREIEKRIDQLGVFINTSPDHGLAAVTDFTPMLKLVDLKGDDPIRSVQHGNLTLCVAFSPDGNFVASGGLGGTICVWDVATGDEHLRVKAHDAAVSGLCYSPDGKWLFSGSDDKSLGVRDANTGKSLWQTTQPDRVWCVAISPDGNYVATGAGGPLYGRPTQLDVLQIDENPIRIWDAKTGDLVREMPGHEHVVRSIDFSTDGSMICSGSFDYTLRVWDVETGTELAAADGEGWVNVARFSPDGGVIVCGGGVRKIDQQWIQSPEERIRVYQLHHEDSASK